MGQDILNLLPGIGSVDSYISRIAASRDFLEIALPIIIGSKGECPVINLGKISPAIAFPFECTTASGAIEP